MSFASFVNFLHSFDSWRSCCGDEGTLALSLGHMLYKDIILSLLIDFLN